MSSAAPDVVTEPVPAATTAGGLSRSKVLRGGAWLAGAVLLALATWNMPKIRPIAGLDDSWVLALHMAAAQGLDFGRDIFFTYGPLGFLSVPILAGTTGFAAYVYSAVFRIAVAFVVLRAASRTYGLGLGVVLAFLALGLPIGASDLAVYLAFFGCVWVLERDEAPTWWWLSVAGGALAAVELLLKLNSGAICFVLGALSVWRLPPGRLRSEGMFAGSFLLTLLILWLITGNPLGELPEWVARSREIASAYTDAMALEPGSRRFEYVLAAALLAGAAALLLPRLRLSRARTVPLLLAAGLYAFAYFKEGFVRHDAHDLAFFSAFAVGMLAFHWRGRARWGALALILGAVVAVLLTPYESLTTLYRPVSLGNTAITDLRDLAPGGRRDRLTESSKESVRRHLAVPPADLRLLEGHTVDVVPQATAAIWAYGLRWQPEPMLQWYMAYDAKLDQHNADAIAERGAERVLRARINAVDGKDTAFEAPATYLALLCHYRELASDARWEVLGRTGNRCGQPRLLGKRQARPGEAIAVPAAPSPDEVVYARIHFPFRVLDRLASLAFKPLHEPRVTLDGADFRFLPATSSSPLVLRVPSSAGRSPFYEGLRSIRTLQLRNVASPFTIEFYAVPVSGSPWVAPPPPRAGRLAGSSLTVGGQRYPIRAGAIHGSIDEAPRRGGAGSITGWAVDTANRQPASRIVAFAGGRLIAEARLTVPRPDVANSYGNSGTVDFGYELALSPRDSAAGVRVFAIAGGRASELPYPAAYPWPR